MITGAIDDLWQNSKDEYIIVDYKATSKNEEINNLDKEWQDGYKRQMEIYQWLFRQNGFKVSETGYFVYCNGNTDKEAFDARLEFDIKIIPYVGNDNWVEKTVLAAIKCMSGSVMPESNPECDFCKYRTAARKIEAPILAQRSFL